MTHTPPVPKDNQSPYPLQEAPHQADASRSGHATPDDSFAPPSPDHSRALAIGAAIGIGTVALAAGVFLFEDRAKPDKRKSKPKAAAKGKSKPKAA